jgi:tetratricopeptide (TPR) repeat protein
MSAPSLGTITLAPISLRSEGLSTLQRRLQSGGLLSRGVVLLGPEGVGKTTFAAEFIALAGSNPADALYVDARQVGAKTLSRILFHSLKPFAQARLRREQERLRAFLDLGKTDIAKATVQVVKLLARHLDERFVLMVDHLETLHTSSGDWTRAEDRHLWKALVEVLERVEGWMLIGCSRIETAEYETLRYNLSPLKCETVVSLLDRFPGLSTLHPKNRQALLEQVKGNLAVLPLLNDLVSEQIRGMRRRRNMPALDEQAPFEAIVREWQAVIEPLLPAQQTLNSEWLAESNFKQLHPVEQKILSRMTLVQHPWSWDWLLKLSELDEPIAERHLEWLMRSSMIDSLPLADGSLGYQLSHAMAEYLKGHPNEEVIDRRNWLQTLAEKMEGSVDNSTSLALRKEAGQLLFQAEEYPRAFDQLLSVAMDTARLGDTLEAKQQLEAFLDYRALTLLEPEQVRALLHSLGKLHLELGKFDQAHLCFDRVHRLTKSLNDPLKEAKALGECGEVYLAEKKHDRAIDCFTRQLTLVRSRLDREAEVEVLSQLGKTFTAAAQFEQAIRTYEEQLILARQLQDLTTEAVALGHLGVALSSAGKIHKSISLFEQRLSLLEKSPDKQAQGQTLINLAAALIQSGQPARAIPFLEQRLLIAREEADTRVESQMLLNLGSAYFSLGQSEKALRFFEERLQMTRDQEDLKGEGQVLCNLGMALGELQQIDKAIGLLEQAQRIGQQLRDGQLIKVANKQLSKLRAGRST